MSGTHGPHLKRRSGIFHFRMKVPEALQLRVGTIEVWRSLKTYSPIKARHLAAKYSVRLTEAFEMMTVKNFSSTQCSTLAIAVFHDLAREAEGTARLDPINHDFEQLEQECLSQERVVQLEKSIAEFRPDNQAVQLAEQSLWARGSSRDNLTDDQFTDVVEAITRALIEQQRLYQFRLSDRLLPFLPNDPMFRPHSLEVAPSQLASGGEVITLSSAIAEYLVDGEQRKKWVPKTVGIRQNRLARLVAHFGEDRQLPTITSHEIRAFRNSLSDLRTRGNAGPGRLIKAKTAQLIFEDVKTFLRWAKRTQAYIERDPSEDVVLSLPKGDLQTRQRRKFRPEELATFFGSPMYKGCYSRRLRFELGNEVYRDSGYWIPLIGYYTGARLGEIVQLEIADIRLLDPTPHFLITDEASSAFPADEVKRVKSRAGRRKVPIHPDLMELGLASFVQIRSGQGRSRLFFDIKFGSDGQASTVFSKRFGRMLGKVGLDDPALCFHSFRHGMEDALRDAQQQPYIIDKIIGHSDNSVSAGYGDGVSLGVAYEAICKAALPLRVVALVAGSP